MKKTFALILFLASLLQVSDAQEQARGDKPYKAYLVSTAHFDNQWNWDVRESIDDYLHRTMVQNFWLFERFPDARELYENVLEASLGDADDW